MSASGQYAIRIILFHAIFPSLRRLRPPSRAVRRPTRARTQSPKKSASTTHITKFIPLHLRGDALVVEASKLVLIGDLDLLLRPGLRVRDVELRARERSKIIASVVALIHRIAAHIHRPHPRPSRAIARARASHESTGTFHSNRSIPRAHHHTVRARARARRSPSTPARDRGDPKGFRPGSRARARRHPPDRAPPPPVAVLPRRATKTRARRPTFAPS